ncbi:MAG: hypothetical protein V1750_03660 [Acidobacteriota bacterium]
MSEPTRQRPPIRRRRIQFNLGAVPEHLLDGRKADDPFGLGDTGQRMQAVDVEAAR